MANISTDLISPISYVAGGELEFELVFNAPEDGTYYILGALYDSNYNYIPGTMFGVILPAGATYAINSTLETQLWTMVAGDTETVDCKLTLDRTSVLLSLFLMKLEDTEPSLTVDEEIGSTTAILAGAAVEGIDLSAVVSLLIVAGMAGIMIKLVK